MSMFFRRENPRPKSSTKTISTNNLTEA
jgi:hypothetical protein